MYVLGLRSRFIVVVVIVVTSRTASWVVEGTSSLLSQGTVRWHHGRVARSKPTQPPQGTGGPMIITDPDFLAALREDESGSLPKPPVLFKTAVPSSRTIPSPPRPPSSTPTAPGSKTKVPTSGTVPPWLHSQSGKTQPPTSRTVPATSPATAKTVVPGSRTVPATSAATSKTVVLDSQPAPSPATSKTVVLDSRAAPPPSNPSPKTEVLDSQTVPATSPATSKTVVPGSRTAPAPAANPRVSAPRPTPEARPSASTRGHASRSRSRPVAFAAAPLAVASIAVFAWFAYAPDESPTEPDSASAVAQSTVEKQDPLPTPTAEPTPPSPAAEPRPPSPEPTPAPTEPAAVDDEAPPEPPPEKPEIVEEPEPAQDVEPVEDPQPVQDPKPAADPEPVEDPEPAADTEPVPEPEPADVASEPTNDGTDPRVAPPGTSPANAEALRLLPLGKNDRPPIGAVGAGGIHVDRIEVGTDGCNEPRERFSVASDDQVNVCVRIVHPRREETVTAEWVFRDEVASKTPIELPARHAHATRLRLRTRDRFVGSWVVRIRSADGVVLGSSAFVIEE